jgi:hypothetical protein
MIASVPRLQSESRGTQPLCSLTHPYPLPPVIELAGGHVQPVDKPSDTDFSSFRPAPDEIHPHITFWICVLIVDLLLDRRPRAPKHLSWVKLSARGRAKKGSILVPSPCGPVTNLPSLAFVC